ncbi:MAG: acetoin dehydrogenase dihydrolipoyllysine-residue acetyltransferase subunit [Pseudomonadota bacterium]
MPVSVIFPKVNLETTSGEISRWAVSDGDEVSEGDILFEVEDDKAAVEVESNANGYIGQLTKEETEVEVGAVVAQIFSTKEEYKAAQTPAGAERVQSETSEPISDLKSSGVFANTPTQHRRSGTINPTPLARRIARENGLSLDGLVGTGPRGRIQKRDVITELERLAKFASQPVSTATSGPLYANWYQKGEGLPVAFIHGFAADHTSWNPMLSGARYSWPSIALDLPCHGQSNSLLPDNLDAIAADVETTLAEKGIDELVIAAHSFGAAVASRIASRGFLRVRALCLFAPAGLSPDINPSFVGGMCRARSKEALLPWLYMLVEDKALIKEAFWERALAARQTDEKFEALRGFAAQFFPDQTQRFNVLDDLANLSGPVRVVFGRQDQILNVNCTRNLPGNVALHIWDHCGHMPQFEHRKQALNILEEVWRSA